MHSVAFGGLLCFFLSSIGLTSLSLRRIITLAFRPQAVDQPEITSLHNSSLAVPRPFVHICLLTF
jgi:hypothetical protein